MSVPDLTKRIEEARPLTPAEHDDNLTKIEEAFEDVDNTSSGNLDAANDYTDDAVEDLVTGPSSATDGDIMQFDGITGNLAKGGKSIVTSISAGSTDDQVPTAKAVFDNSGVTADSGSINIGGTRFAWYPIASIVGPKSESEDVTTSVGIGGFSSVYTVIISNTNVSDEPSQRAYFQLRSFTTSSVELRFHALHTFQADKELSGSILVIGTPS